MFTMSKKEAVLANIQKSYENYISKELGFVVNVIDVEDIKEGIIVPGDGAGYYEATFNLLTYKPELNEVVFGRIRDITDFGAFMLIGAIEGLVHVSQSMDDFVSFSKEKVLQGKKSGQTLKVNDHCKARIIAVSYKDITNPKIGLTMRQEGLGKIEKSPEQVAAEKAEEKAAEEASAAAEGMETEEEAEAIKDAQQEE
jgi:DNA-directed RNA polymerase subunit E'